MKYVSLVVVLLAILTVGAKDSEIDALNARVDHLTDVVRGQNEVLSALTSLVGDAMKKDAKTKLTILNTEESLVTQSDKNSEDIAAIKKRLGMK